MNSKRDASQLAASEFQFWWVAFSGAAGSLALISLMQRVIEVGLAPLPGLIVHYYRGATAPLRDALLWLMPISLPEWYTDLFVIACLFTAIFVRTVLSRFRPTLTATKQKLTLPGDVLVLVLGACVVGILTLTSLLLPLGALFIGARAPTPLSQIEDEQQRRRALYAKMAEHGGYILARQYLFSIAVSIAVAIAFFAWNFQG